MTGVIENQARQLEVLTAQNAEMSQRIKELMAQIAYFQRRMFGRGSEKNLNLENQPSLFDAVGVEIPTEEPMPTSPEKETAEGDGEEATASKKNRKGRKHHRINLDNLPVLETRVINPEQPVDMSRYRLMGYEETYRLGFQPGKLYRILERREKYGLIDPTEPVERGQGVIIAPAPKLYR